MRKLFFSILMLIATVVMAQQMPPVPVDQAYRIGKLDNGLTYYIRQNKFPENVANFYIAQRVGSIQEEDSQRGLAHFLEHMAFNGSNHFPGDALLDYTRSLGVAFGKDLNAYTSIEETVYNIDNVPTTRQSALDSCLLILQDWSNGLHLLPAEIDKERGVVHGEWAMRSSANQRLFERNLPGLYPGCKYGERLPIGTMEVVDNFSPKELRDYYEKWYHPENQAIIVIGDIDVDYTEAKIKELFSGIKAGPNAAHVTPVAVADNNEAIYIFDKDKEMQYSLFQVYMKSEAFPREMKGTMAEYVQAYVSHLVTSMFNSRMTELTLQPDCPFVQLNMEYGNYILSSTKDATSLLAVAKEGKETETLKALVREARRVKEFGYTASEFVRAKEEFMSWAEKQYTNRDKRKHTEYYRQCVDNYLHGDAMADAETTYQLWQMLSQQIPLEMINQAAAEMITIDNDTNFVCTEFAQEKEGGVYHSTEDMKSIVNEARGEQLTAWVDNAKDEPLIAVMPKAGKIKKEVKNEALGYTELQLSNGAKVILKKTDFKDDEVILSGFAKGGECMYGAADYSNLKVFDNFINACGLGNFTNNELEKALAGKQASAGISFGRRYKNVSGRSTPKDMETMMQLLYLHFTALNKDEKACNMLMQQLETILKNRNLRPETELSDSIALNMNQHNPRFASLTMDDMPNINVDRIYAMAKEQYSAANDFTFTIIGNFDEQLARQFVCQYIASLPGKAKPAKTTDIRTLFTGNNDCQFTRKMETPKPYIVQAYKSEVDYTLENDVLSDYVGEVLSMVLLKSVREDAGAAYSVGASTGLNVAPEKTYSMMQIQAPISDPTKVDTALVLIQQGIEEVAKQADADMVAKVKANMLKEADVNAKQNSYWQSVIENYLINGVDAYTNFKAVVEAVTPEKVSKYLREVILKSGDRINVVMRPE